MAVTKLTICNEALIQIGGQMITALTEDSEPARLCNYLFDEQLDQELELGNWSFAIGRKSLTALVDDPAFEYTYHFNLPDDCLHVISEFNENNYAIEGRKLLSDATTIQIKYVRRITDMAELSPLFRRAFVFKLASLLAVPLQGSAKLKEGMEALYEFWISRAKFRDSQGSGTPPEQDDGSWIEARSL